MSWTSEDTLWYLDVLKDQYLGKVLKHLFDEQEELQKQLKEHEEAFVSLRIKLDDNGIY